MADTTDPQRYAEGLQKERDALAESDAVHEADRDAIKRYLRRRDGAVKVSTLGTYLRRLRVASERSDVPLVALEESDYHELVFVLRHEYDLADSTVRTYENAILPFLGRMTSAEWTDDIERTNVETSGPDVDELLDPADIQALTRAANSARDTALIEFLADTGARLSLVVSLRTQDVDLSDPPTYRPNPNADGLKDAPITDYPLVDSAAAIRSYLRNSHPRPDEPDAALFHALKPFSRDGDERWTDAGALHPNAAYQQLQRIADRAEIDKPTNPHAFRHAAITRMVREGYSRSQIEHRVHWTLDTDMWDTYEHITADEHNEDIFRHAGILEEPDEGPDQVRKRCGTCNDPLAPHHDFCPTCGTAASARAQEIAAEGKETILDELVGADDQDVRAGIRQLATVLEEHPEVATELAAADGHADPSGESS
jgi:integrase